MSASSRTAAAPRTVRKSVLSRTAAAATVLFLAGSIGACTGAGAARLQGHWRGVRAEGVPGDVAAAANAFATGVSIDVRGDSMSVTQGDHRQVGRYRVVEEDAAKVVLTTDADGPLEPHTFVYVDQDTMRWDAVGGKGIVFVRK
jgi:hypothetical protein